MPSKLWLRFCRIALKTVGEARRTPTGKIDMTKAPKKEPSLEDVELVPDAWPLFEKFVRDIAKSPPKHKTADTKPKPSEKSPKA